MECSLVVYLVEWPVKQEGIIMGLQDILAGVFSGIAGDPYAPIKMRIFKEQKKREDEAAKLDLILKNLQLEQAKTPITRFLKPELTPKQGFEPETGESFTLSGPTGKDTGEIDWSRARIGDLGNLAKFAQIQKAQRPTAPKVQGINPEHDVYSEGVRVRPGTPKAPPIHRYNMPNVGLVDETGKVIAPAKPGYTIKEDENGEWVYIPTSPQEQPQPTPGVPQGQTPSPLSGISETPVPFLTPPTQAVPESRTRLIDLPSILQAQEPAPVEVASRGTLTAPTKEEAKPQQPGVRRTGVKAPLKGTTKGLQHIKEDFGDRVREGTFNPTTGERTWGAWQPKGTTPEKPLNIDKAFASYNVARAKAPSDPIRLQMIATMKQMGIDVPVSLPEMDKKQFEEFVKTGKMPGTKANEPSPKGKKPLSAFEGK